MLNNILKFGLGLGLVVSLSNAETFKKGSTVEIKSGYIKCFIDKKEKQEEIIKSVDMLTKDIYLWANDVINNLKSKKTGLPKLKMQKNGFCTFYNNNGEATFLLTMKNGISLLENKDNYIIAYENSLKKGANKTKEPTYSFVGSDDLDAFPSDYIGKKIYLECKKSRTDEDREGGYKVFPLCADSKGKYGFMSIGLKVKIHTNSRDVARSLAKSGKQKKLLMGTVKKNTAKYSMYKNIFEIEEVQYK